MGPDDRRHSQETFGQVLAELKHLDLTGHVEYESPRRPVARGGFGEVYKGYFKRSDGTVSRVAIKCLTVYLDGSRDTARIFKREIKAWCKLKHPNVLSLLGFSLEDTGSHALGIPSLVSEWMDNGNVLDFVKNNPDTNIATLALGMAEGLAYLHENNVIHADFKSANVLISSTLEPVICDFGCAHVTLGDTLSTVSNVRGSTRWMAYELLSVGGNPEPTKESDTWAFGMTVYELLANGCPYGDIQIEAQVIFSIVQGKVPPRPSSLSGGYKARLWHICTETWIHDHTQRPSVSEVARRIKTIPKSTFAAYSVVTGQAVIAHDKDSPENIMQLLREEFPHYELSGQGTQIPLSSFHVERFAVDYLSNYNSNTVFIFRTPLDGPVAHFRRMLLKIIRILSIPEVQHHPNIQTLLGYFWDSEKSQLCLVFDYDDEGQLMKTYLENNPSANVVQITLQIARGIESLHNHGIVHGDIKLSNMRFHSRGMPVITSFICSHYANCARDMEGIFGSTKWMAPEMFLKQQKDEDDHMARTQSDVWAFGMMIYEIISGQTPYVGIKRTAEAIIRISQGEVPRHPPSFDAWPASRKALWGVCKQCWKQEFRARPSVRTLIKKLEALLEVQELIDTEESTEVGLGFVHLVWMLTKESFQ